jgi:RNase P protein component
LLRETCRIALGESRGPWDLILIARVEVLDIPFAERLRVLASLLRQAGVLSEEVEAA